MKYLRSEVLLMCLSLIISVACTPQFNAKDKKKGGGNSGPPIVGTRKLTQVFDANVQGGGALGASANYRISGVNIGYMVKTQGTSPGFKVRGGMDGQLAP